MANAIDTQSALTMKWPYDLAHERGHAALLRAFARANGVKEGEEFTLDALARGMCSGGSWGEPYRWPGCDHPRFFKQGRRAALIVSEPYVTPDVDALRSYAADKGLVMQMPPNPKASFWCPPHTYFIVLTAPSFGRVSWLEAQLDYDGGEAARRCHGPLSRPRCGGYSEALRPRARGSP